MDNHWARLEGGQATVEFVDGSIYLAISLRNVGPGLAVPFGWSSWRGRPLSISTHATLRTSACRRATSTWSFRHRVLAGRHPRHDDPDFAWLSTAIVNAEAFTLEILYGDHEGGQRTITRFG